MIVLNLQCDVGHAFEGWFSSTSAFDEQVRAGQVSCPVCGHAQVTRLPSGPRVMRKGLAAESKEQVPLKGPEAAPAIDPAKVLQALASLMSNAEDVSTRFADEARKIHYGEAEARNIKGKATLEETSELLEEGIPVLPIPFPDKESMH